MSQKFDKIKQEENDLICNTYNRYPIAVQNAHDCRVWDVDGKEYVDLLAGIAVVGLGHCNEELCMTLAKQSHKLWHVSNLFYQEEQLNLANILLSTTHHSKVFFCNSGAEANEACIKLARRCMRTVKRRDAYEIITLQDCFHGRTYGALAATGRKNLCDGFTPLPAGFVQVPAGDIQAMKDAITPKTAAVLLEVVQGESGIIPLPADYLLAIQKLCRQNNIFFICDEVQAGLCRTGKFWAFQHYGLKPDAITVAKSLANGLPIGAMLATDEMSRGFVPGSHATTFGGGALVSAIAAKTVEIMLRDKLADRAWEIGLYTLGKLDDLKNKFPDKIVAVRGLGLMLGIELAESGETVFKELLTHGFICNISHNTTLRLLPPLTISKEDIDAFIAQLDEILVRL